jgi:hypothetical protein
VRPRVAPCSGCCARNGTFVACHTPMFPHLRGTLLP